jgi:hypothetical protein
VEYSVCPTALTLTFMLLQRRTACCKANRAVHCVFYEVRTYFSKMFDMKIYPKRSIFIIYIIYHFLFHELHFETTVKCQFELRVIYGLHMTEEKENGNSSSNFSTV